MKAQKSQNSENLHQKHASHLRVVDTEAPDHNKKHESVKSRKRRITDNPLRKLRIEMGFTLDDLAQTSQLSPSYLSRLEGGSRRLNGEVLMILAKALQCNPDCLEVMTSPLKNTFSGKQSSGQKHPKESVVTIPIHRLSSVTSGAYAVEWLAHSKTTVSRGLGLSQDCFALKVEPHETHLRPFMIGSYLYINPRAQLGQGDPVFVMRHDDVCFIGIIFDYYSDSGIEYFVFKYYQSIQAQDEKEEQDSTQHTIKLQRSEIKKLFCVVQLNERSSMAS